MTSNSKVLFQDHKVPDRLHLEDAAHHKVGLCDTPRRFVLVRCRYSSLEKFEDAFDTASG